MKTKVKKTQPIKVEDLPTKFTLTIKPAIPPEKRHLIETLLKEMGYVVDGGGTCMDMSECDISFANTIEKGR